MYRFELTDKFLSKQEQEVFHNYLIRIGLDNSIWQVFECLFKSSTKYTNPVLLKVYREEKLESAAIFVKCSKYGRTLFNNRFLAGIINTFQIPFYLWVRLGCCMDFLSNPGFVRDPEKTNELITAMIDYINKNSILSIINDYSDNDYFYTSASILPSLPHAVIDTSKMNSIEDYINEHKNIKKKINKFCNRGGEFTIIPNQLSKEDISYLKNCFLSTAEKSIFYLPYQDLYLNSVLNSAGQFLPEVIYFIAKLNGKFIGYQAAVKTGNHLNALNGAFDRSLSTTYHAYDILFVKMTEYAINNNLTTVDFGAVLNVTKQRMINKQINMSYYLMSRSGIIKTFFNNFLKMTKIQGEKQMQFSNFKR